MTVGGSNLCSGSVAVSNPLLFAGQYRDDETGLYYLRARYYEPSTGQFISLDPLVDASNDPYGYGSEDPINIGDPGGLWPAMGNCAPWNMTCKFTWNYNGTQYTISVAEFENCLNHFTDCGTAVRIANWAQNLAGVVFAHSSRMQKEYRHALWATTLQYRLNNVLTSWGFLEAHEIGWPNSPGVRRADEQNDWAGIFYANHLRQRYGSSLSNFGISFDVLMSVIYHSWWWAFPPADV